ncbi:hypothetical protein CC86DRAFT_405673 [Ophiobolus disseminans]|uniref:TNFR-Cys domain-containing protein n=1 Tax=Ophiobolus disseminans TaxID=1469910 RepID=A0A6A7A413_9PLEO|nr:hypothetical protein CC86DRAFT_405673 [Ophiobolus disseminans]
MAVIKLFKLFAAFLLISLVASTPLSRSPANGDGWCMANCRSEYDECIKSHQPAEDAKHACLTKMCRDNYDYCGNCDECSGKDKLEDTVSTEAVPVSPPAAEEHSGGCDPSCQGIHDICMASPTDCGDCPRCKKGVADPHCPKSTSSTTSTPPTPTATKDVESAGECDPDCPRIFDVCMKGGDSCVFCHNLTCQTNRNKCGECSSCKGGFPTSCPKKSSTIFSTASSTTSSPPTPTTTTRSVAAHANENRDHARRCAVGCSDMLRRCLRKSTEAFCHGFVCSTHSASCGVCPGCSDNKAAESKRSDDGAAVTCGYACTNTCTLACADDLPQNSVFIPSTSSAMHITLADGQCKTWVCSTDGCVCKLFGPKPEEAEAEDENLCSNVCDGQGEKCVHVCSETDVRDEVEMHLEAHNCRLVCDATGKRCKIWYYY